jgi:hypothetical protein
VLDDAVAVPGAAGERLEDQQLEGARYEIGRGVRESHQRVMGR